MSELDNEELKSTRKLNGADTKIVIDKRALEEIEQKYEEYKKYVQYQEDWAYYDGIIRTIRAIKEGDLSKI